MTATLPALDRITSPPSPSPISTEKRPGRSRGARINREAMTGYGVGRTPIPARRVAPSLQPTKRPDTNSASIAMDAPGERTGRVLQVARCAHRLS